MSRAWRTCGPGRRTQTTRTNPRTTINGMTSTHKNGSTMSETAAAAFREFLSGHMVVSILVLPGACTGLDDFPRAVPLRLDLSHSFSPPMWAEPSGAGLDFHA